jgi:hypothetical protein
VQALVCLLNRVLSYKLLIRGALTHRRSDVHRRRDGRRQSGERRPREYASEVAQIVSPGALPSEDALENLLNPN